MFKNIIKFISAASLLVFVSTANAHITTEFGLSLSKASVNQFLSQIAGEFKIIDEPVELEKEGILKDLKYSSSKLFLDANLDIEFANGDSVAARAEVGSVGIKLKDFKYTDVSIIKQAGVNARVTTKILCTELVIELNDWTIDLTSPVRFKEGKFILDRLGGALNSVGTAVNVDLSQCVAPVGVDLVLKELILKWIASPEGNSVLFGAVLDYGQGFIDTEFDRLKTSLNLDILNKKIDILFESVSFLKDKVEVLGLLKAESAKNNYTLSLNKSDFDQAATGADVIFPKTFFSKLFPDFIKETVVKLKLKRADIPQVDFLFNSRFIQFFVWGDLLNFKKSTDFLAEIAIATQNVKLGSLGPSLKYKVGGQHRIDLDLLNSKGTKFPYIDFRGNLTADLSLDFTNQGISLAITNPDLSAASRWDDKMRSWRRSSAQGGPWMSVIVPQINKALNKTLFDYSWSDFGLGDYIQKAKLYHSDKSTFIGVSLN